MILMYHNVDDEAGFNTISVKSFEEQIAYLISRKEFNIVSIDDYVESLKFQKKQKSVTITFDDAYVSLVSKVLPIIKKYNVPISFFVPISFVGKHNMWDTIKGDKKIDILTWEEIRILHNEKLITIGSHGQNHISLGNIDLEGIQNELLKSKNILEKEIGSEVKYFSFPYGQLKDICKNSSEILKKYGYKAGLSTIWNRTNNSKNQYLLQRIEIRNTDDLDSFKSILNRRIDFKFFKQQLKNVLFILMISKIKMA